MSEIEKKDENKNIIANEVPEPSSSLALEIFVFIHKIYMIFYNIVLFLLFIFKRFAFEYPYENIIPDVALAIIFLIIDIFRIRLTSIGNKTERALILLFAVIFDVIILFEYLFFIFIQTYVTNFYLVFSIIGLVTIFFELLFSFLTMFNIKVHEKSI